jgi:hypothetical protein
MPISKTAAKSAALPKISNELLDRLVSGPMTGEAGQRGQRCLIPVDSFLEANRELGKNVWWRIARADGEPWGLAACGTPGSTLPEANWSRATPCSRSMQMGARQQLVVAFDAPEHGAGQADRRQRVVQFPRHHRHELGLAPVCPFGGVAQGVGIHGGKHELLVCVAQIGHSNGSKVAGQPGNSGALGGSADRR